MFSVGKTAQIIAEMTRYGIGILGAGGQDLDRDDHARPGEGLSKGSWKRKV